MTRNDQSDPIFILWARSFWLGILPVMAIAFDVIMGLASDPSQGPPLAGLIAAVFGLDAVAVEATMLKLSPLFAMVIAQQRSGAARPYSLNPGDAK